MVHGRDSIVKPNRATRTWGGISPLRIKDGRVPACREKPQGEGGWIDGGFFVLADTPRLIRSNLLIGSLLVEAMCLKGGRYKVNAGASLWTNDCVVLGRHLAQTDSE